MKKVLFVALIGIFASCGGGGGDDSDNDLRCSNEKPLLCEGAEACCARGLPYYCDGVCYPVELANCGQSDTCTFDTRIQSDIDLNEIEASDLFESSDSAE